MNENEIWKMIEDAHGDVFDTTDKETKAEHLKKATRALDIGLSHFKKNCSWANYNSMLLALMSYQYWTQKKVIE
jgi:hypothetical protein|tara:strand:+ start:652 stop:873 length:222 start_codon:yes stop_codon:yes gene_type:complete